jgi:hypothetical protein
MDLCVSSCKVYGLHLRLAFAFNHEYYEFLAVFIHHSLCIIEMAVLDSKLCGPLCVVQMDKPIFLHQIMS